MVHSGFAPVSWPLSVCSVFLFVSFQGVLGFQEKFWPAARTCFSRTLFYSFWPRHADHGAWDLPYVGNSETLVDQLVCWLVAFRSHNFDVAPVKRIFVLQTRERQHVYILFFNGSSFWTWVCLKSKTSPNPRLVQTDRSVQPTDWSALSFSMQIYEMTFLVCRSTCGHFLGSGSCIASSSTAWWCLLLWSASFSFKADIFDDLHKVASLDQRLL